MEDVITTVEKPRFRKSKREVVGLCLYAEARGKEVRFKSIRDAGRWLMPEKPASAAASISNCLSGKQKTAYMISWRYGDVRPGVPTTI